MLRFKEKEDFEARFSEVDEAVELWRIAHGNASEELRGEFLDKLIISLIYHDSALEGEVLTHSEIKAAIDVNIISDSSLIPAYEQITNFHAANQLAIELAKMKKKIPLNLELLKQFYALLKPEAKAEGLPYRKENPLHRLYYHDISPPEKIAASMKKFGDWLESEGFGELHAIDRVAQSHHKLMAIFPWASESGRLARIVANFCLSQANYPLAVIHSIDRQRYYEALRETDAKPLLSVYLEAVETTANSAVRVYEEAAKAGRRRRAG